MHIMRSSVYAPIIARHSCFGQISCLTKLVVDMVLYSLKFLSAAGFMHNSFMENNFCVFIFGHHCDTIFH